MILTLYGIWYIYLSLSSGKARAEVSNTAWHLFVHPYVTFISSHSFEPRGQKFGMHTPHINVSKSVKLLVNGSKHLKLKSSEKFPWFDIRWNPCKINRFTMADCYGIRLGIRVSGVRTPVPAAPGNLWPLVATNFCNKKTFIQTQSHLEKGQIAFYALSGSFSNRKAFIINKLCGRLLWYQAGNWSVRALNSGAGSSRQPLTPGCHKNNK